MAKSDVWAVGDLYEPYVGRWSRVVAREFLAWLAVEPDRDWLDVGCGTGALTQTILETAVPRSVRGVDPSPGFIEYARAHTDNDRASFEIGDAQALPVGDTSVDVAVSGLVLNFVPNPGRGVEEMSRAVRPEGVLGAYVWDYAARMEMMRHFWDAVVAMDPGASDLDEGRRCRICSRELLSVLFVDAGLTRVQVRPLDVPTHFRDFDDFWSPFLGGQGPAPAYAMSLDEDRRARLRERIRADLPTSVDGSIHLIARAWAVKAQKAGP